MLRAGRLKHTVTLQRQIAATDSWGAPSETWQNVSTTVFAEVIASPGAESTQLGQTIATNSYTVTIRYRSGVTPQHRFQWRGKTLNITSVIDPDGNQEMLVCQCTEDAG